MGPITPLELSALVFCSLYLLFLWVERKVLKRLRRTFLHVVHVNGTRGKTETTRMLAAIFSRAGFRVMAKTTGTEARVIMPDGRERVLKRWGASNVREQRNLLLQAWRARAKVLIVECMAVKPEAQDASHCFLAPDILVLTNNREDHTAELGDWGNRAEVFSRNLPRGGMVVTADPGLYHALLPKASLVNAQVHLSEPYPLGAGIPENAGLARSVALLTGIEESVIREGILSHSPDPGKSEVRFLERPKGPPIPVLDCLAANDPESVDKLLDLWDFPRLWVGNSIGKRVCEESPSGDEPKRTGESEGKWTNGTCSVPAVRPLGVLVIATRSDRPDRSVAFCRWAARRGELFDQVWVVGPLPFSARREFYGGRGPRVVIPFGSSMEDCLRALGKLNGSAWVVAVGNWVPHGRALGRLPLKREML